MDPPQYLQSTRKSVSPSVSPLSHPDPFAVSTVRGNLKFILRRPSWLNGFVCVILARRGPYCVGRIPNIPQLSGLLSSRPGFIPPCHGDRLPQVRIPGLCLHVGLFAGMYVVSLSEQHFKSALGENHSFPLSTTAFMTVVQLQTFLRQPPSPFFVGRLPHLQILRKQPDRTSPRPPYLLSAGKNGTQRSPRRLTAIGPATYKDFRRSLQFSSGRQDPQTPFPPLLMLVVDV